MKLDKYDNIFSLFIRTRAGWKCQRCGTQYQPPTQALHCSHFYGRAKKSVRWDPENAWAHCYGCHRYLGSNPVEFREWALKKLGASKFHALMRRAMTTKKWTPKEKEEIYQKYKAMLKKMNAN